MKILVFTAAVLFFTSSIAFSNQVSEKETSLSEEEVSPNEDLMREHGILNRLLLIYQEIARRIDNRETFPAQTLKDTAALVRNFLENYHEKLEEEFIFPRFEKAGLLLDLVKTLKDQHDAGRKLTNYIIAHSSDSELESEIKRMILADYLRLYVRMFRPHEAREDTVLFPAFRKLLPTDEYMKLGDVFEEREHELFGKNGFEDVVEQVSKIEQQLNIGNLSQFTPGF